MKVTNGSIYRKNISNNLPAAVEVKSADKTEAVEGPKIWGSPGLPYFRRPFENDTKVLDKSQKMS